ncbi:hypothetical protein BJ741DRAFT_614500, partial [Chytriomyces cf. hyalinus JEL632]
MVSAAYVILAYSLAVVSATPIPQAAEPGTSTSEVVAPIDQVGENLTPISEAAGQLAAAVPGEGGRGSVRAASEGGNRSGGLYDPAVLVLMPYVMPPAAGGEGGSRAGSEGGAKGEGSSSTSRGEGSSKGSSTSGEGKSTSSEGGRSSTGSSSSKGEGKAAGEQSSSSGSSSEGGSKERASTENTPSESGALGTATATGLVASACFKSGVSLVAAALTFIMAF